ncbi:radical SAM protein, partial [Rhizobiaceae sp. 2RAB30]
MSKDEWENIYREAWSLYYTPEHMRTLLRRAVATGVPVHSLVKLLVTFGTSVPLENMHPLQTGILRLMRPNERRPGLPVESPFAFWPRLAWRTVRKNVAIASRIVNLTLAGAMIKREAGRARYMDQALTPVGDDDETLDLLTKTTGGSAAIAHIKKVAGLTAAARVD